jgi:hypothetical protein
MLSYSDLCAFGKVPQVKVRVTIHYASNLFGDFDLSAEA